MPNEHRNPLASDLSEAPTQRGPDAPREGRFDFHGEGEWDYAGDERDNVEARPADTRQIEPDDWERPLPPDYVSEEDTAFHEAAHLVVAGYNGILIGRDSIITIVPSEAGGYLGMVEIAGTRMPPRDDLLAVAPAGRPRLLLHRVTFLLAGGVGSRGYCSLASPGDWVDRSTARAIAAEESGEQLAWSLTYRAERLARQQVRRLWPAVKKLAAALLVHKTLRAEDGFKYALTAFTDGQIRTAATRGPSILGADLAQYRHWHDNPVELRSTMEGYSPEKSNSTS